VDVEADRPRGGGLGGYAAPRFRIPKEEFALVRFKGVSEVAHLMDVHEAQFLHPPRLPHEDPIVAE
jgi:hypothetical protein